MRRLRNLLAGLPADARTRRENPDTPMWGFDQELLAQLVEEVSILAADYRRKKPREVPRPTSPEQAAKKRSNHGGLLSAAMTHGRVRRV